MDIRPYRADDADRAIGLINGSYALDDTLEPVTPDGWAGFVARSYNRGGRDFALALGGAGATIALLMSHRTDDARHFRIIVHPEWRRQGVGTALLRVVEGQPGAVEQTNVVSRWRAGAAFLERFRFRPADRMIDMVRDGPAPDAVAPPAGVRLRAYDGSARDDAAWIALNDEGYRGTPHATPLTPADLANFRAGAGFHLWIAEEADRIVGLCHTFLWQDRPHVNSVVVASSAQGRGLGRALTVAGMRTLAEKGHTRVELNVLAGNAPALRIYESLGFTTVDEVVTYRRRR